MRYLNPFELLICDFDAALRTVLVPGKRMSKRPNPAEHHSEQPLNHKEQRHVAGLMRVNHTGEVCAQALYQGQAATAQLDHVKQQMLNAADEEIDHLAWCEERLRELNSKPSVLNIFWYGASFTLGALAGLAGDKWSLGFVAETERQVTAHLQKHLQRLPVQDIKTKTILAQMQADEEHHADVAIKAGAIELPFFMKQCMAGASKLMTGCSYYL